MSSLDEFDHNLIIGPESDVDLARRTLPVGEILVEPRLIRQPNPYSDVFALTRLVRTIKMREPAFVFTHQSKAGALGRVASRLAGGVPVVHSLSMASFGPGYSKGQSAAYKWVEARLASHTAAYAVVGSHLMGQFLQVGVPAEKLHLIRSGAPIPRVEETSQLLKARLADEYRAPAHQPWLVYVGSLEARKNVLMLPELLRRTHALCDEKVRPHLLVIGEGPQRAQLEYEIAVSDLEPHVTVAGYVHDVGPVMKASDVLVLLSSVEGLPQVLVQSAAVGTPFVSFEVDGVEEVLALGARGTVVERGNIDSAARAVADRLADPGASIEFDLSSWSPESIRAEYRSVIDKLLGDC